MVERNKFISGEGGLPDVNDGRKDQLKKMMKDYSVYGGRPTEPIAILGDMHAGSSQAAAHGRQMHERIERDMVNQFGVSREIASNGGRPNTASAAAVAQREFARRQIDRYRDFARDMNGREE